MGFRREAIAAARQALRCAAALGMIEANGMVYGDWPGKHRRLLPLAAAMDRGRLEAVLDAMPPLSLSEETACTWAQKLGMGWVSRPAIASRVRSRGSQYKPKKQGTKGRPRGGLQRLCIDAGLPPHALRALISSQRSAVAYWPARKLTKAVGIDVSDLPPARKVTTSKKRSAFITDRLRPGNGRWDEAAVRYTKMRDEMTRADPGWPDKPLFYEAMKTISDIIQKEIRAAEKDGA